MFKSLRGLHMLQCYLEVETEAERDCNGLFFSGLANTQMTLWQEKEF